MDLTDPQQLYESGDSARSPNTERGFCWTDALAALADPSLDPLFWRAERLGAESAWWEHVPVAHWLVCATAPRVLVELGTHTGVSYTAFCHAVARAGLGTRCHAVDTWQGDKHAGLYGPEVLNDLRAFHDERFGAFSTLLQCTFDEALAHIEDGSIDLLHIDGLHTYEAVRRDFENWLPKLSDRAVVLFHDINVRRDDFGVWRLWAELRQLYPAFDFVHGYGLGVLAVGRDIPPPVAALCELTDPAAIAMIRTRFAWLGERWLIDTRLRSLAQTFSEHVALANAQAEQLRAEIAQRSAEAEQLRSELGRHRAEAEQPRSELARHRAEAEQLRAGIAQRSAEVEQLRAGIAQRSAEVEQVRSELARHRAKAEQLQAEVARHAGEVEAARQASGQASARASDAEKQIADLRAEGERAAALLSLSEVQGNAAAARVAELDRLLGEAQGERHRLQHELADVLRSTFWQITAPGRRIAAVLPPGLRRQGRRGARVAYWLLTPHRTWERIAYFRARREALRRPPPLVVDPPPAEDPDARQHSSLIRFFDANWYIERYGDVNGTGLTPFEHFLIHGTRNQRDPNPAFDTAWYFEAYAEIASECVALEDFVHRGSEENRRPFRDFDYDCYREQAQIPGTSNLEAYHHYLTFGRPKAIPTYRVQVPVRLRSDLNPSNSGAVTHRRACNKPLMQLRERGRKLVNGRILSKAADTEIRCLKATSFDDEVALFVTYSPDNELKPHVLHYVQSLRREGISIVLIINAEQPLAVSTAQLLSDVDGLFVRQNKGSDFAAWAHILELHPQLLNIQILYLINDSLIGPIDQAEFSCLINKIRDSNADVIGLTENLEGRWHLQSCFLAFKERALRSAAFEKFFKSIVCVGDKRDAAREYELRLANILKAAGLGCEPIFRAWDARNPTTGHWEKLLEVGFSFINAQLIGDPNLDGNSASCFELLAARGFDLQLADAARARRKPAIVFISGLPGSPSEIFRVFHPAKVLGEMHQTAIFTADDLGHCKELIGGAELLVIFRTAWSQQLAEIVNTARTNNCLVVFDTDDYVFEPEIAHTEFVDGIRFLPEGDISAYHEGVIGYRKTLEAADCCVVTTEFLAERVSELGKTAYVLPNAIAPDMLARFNRAVQQRRLQPLDRELRIGYAAGTLTHQRDFGVAVVALCQLLTRHDDLILTIVGQLELNEFPELLPFSSRIERRPTVALDRLPFELVRFDINIAPLEIGNPYCEAKSELKFFDAAMLEVPTVASATAPFRAAIRHGESGFLAETSEDWLESLSRLIDDRRLRIRVGKLARAEALRRFGPSTMRHNVKRLFDELHKQRSVMIPQRHLGYDDFMDTINFPEVPVRQRSQGTALSGGSSLKLHWIIGDFPPGAGGMMSIIRIVGELEKRGHNNTLWVYRPPPHLTSRESVSAHYTKLIADHFLPLAAEVFPLPRNLDEIVGDAVIATHHSTAYPARAVANVARRFYFLQDHEPEFSPAGYAALFARATYTFGFDALSNGGWLHEMAKRYGMWSMQWDQAADPKHYFLGDPESRLAHHIAFYARSETPRRAVELGHLAFEALARDHVDFHVDLFGSDLAPGPLPYRHTHHGVLSAAKLGELYRRATIGMVFSVTNYSIIPGEMMACGLPVIELNSESSRYSFPEGVAVLVEATPQAVAAQLKSLLSDRRRRDQLARRAREFIARYSWEKSARDIESALMFRLGR
jgi:glycosyltransferase involved in cell wall biosynthesis